jgi:hypothetical protein
MWHTRVLRAEAPSHQRGRAAPSVTTPRHGSGTHHAAPSSSVARGGFAPDPDRTNDFDATRRLLVADPDLHFKQARRLGLAPEKYVWHCSIRAAPEDRILSAEEWADIARRVVAATGIAPDGDPDGCRWVAVRHAPDHIHIAATKVRADLRTARHWNDYLTADRELAAIEKEYSLHKVVRGDRTAAKRPTRAEQEKALRAGQEKDARGRLRTAVAAVSSMEEFVHLLSHLNGVLVEVVYFPSGDVRGYKVAAEDIPPAGKEPVWFSRSELAPDLSFPKIRQRLEAVDRQPADQPGRRRPNPWHQATAATERIPHRLDQDDDQASQAHLAAFGEALDVLPLLTPQPLRTQLREAATAFERATRSRIGAEHRHTRALRGAVRAMVREPVPKDGAVLAMFLDAAILVVIAAARWHELRHHDQQVAAAQEALLHLQAAYDQASAEPLAALASRRPPRQAVDRHIRQLRQAVPEHVDQIIEDPAFDALTTALAEAEAAGHNASTALAQALTQLTLDDAHSPARALIWRIHRLADRHAPGPRTQAVTRAHHIEVPSTAPRPEQSRARRR